MLIILFLIAIAIIVIGCVIFNKSYKYEAQGASISTFGVIFLICIIIVCIIAITKSVKINSMDERIAIYQEENARIEEQIKTAIQAYQEHEENIYGQIDLENISSEKLLLITSVYPELKSDTMVQTQIQVYIDNTNEIKALRTEKINCTIWRWWLCFV